MVVTQQSFGMQEMFLVGKQQFGIKLLFLDNAHMVGAALMWTQKQAMCLITLMKLQTKNEEENQFNVAHLCVTLNWNARIQLW